MKIPKALAVPNVGSYAVILSAAERIHLLNILPQQGDILLLRRVEELKKKLLFTKEEEAQWAMNASGGAYNWDPEAKTDTVVEVGQRMWDEVAKILSDLEKERKLGLHQITLYEKLVECSAAGESEG